MIRGFINVVLTREEIAALHNFCDSNKGTTIANIIGKLLLQKPSLFK